MKGMLHIALHATPRPQTPGRALDFLRRQNAWFETLIEKLGRAASDPANLEAFLANEPALTEEWAQYDREAKEVRTEWNKVSRSVSPEARAEIDALARRGEALVAELRAAYARIIRDVEKQVDVTRTALQTLGRGRNIVQRYAFENPDDALYVDRKA
jgi:hypothetical protein